MRSARRQCTPHLVRTREKASWGRIEEFVRRSQRLFTMTSHSRVATHPTARNHSPDSSWFDARLAELAIAEARGERQALERLVAGHPEWNAETTVRLIYEQSCIR